MAPALRRFDEEDEEEEEEVPSPITRAPSPESDETAGDGHVDIDPARAEKYHTAQALWNGDGNTHQDGKQAVAILSELREGSDIVAAYAAYLLGEIFLMGTPRSTSSSKSVRRDSRAAFQSFEEAVTKIFEIEEKTKSVKKDDVLPVAGPALHYLSFFHGTGFEGVTPRDETTAYRLTQIAAKRGHGPAWLSLGFKNMYGIGVKSDCEEALSLYKQAAWARQQGGAGAGTPIGESERLSKALVGALSQVQDKTDRQFEVMNYWESQAKGGDPAAMYELGKLHEDGAGGGAGRADSARKAAELYENAGEQGVAAAYIDLGVMYLNGNGVEKDQRKALECFKKAADMGEAQAQNLMGYLKLSSKDYEEARAYFEAAALQEWPESLFYLGEMELTGITENQKGMAAGRRPQLSPTEVEGLKRALRFYERAGDGGYVIAWWREAQLWESPSNPFGRDCWKATAAYKAVAEAGAAGADIRKGVQLFVNGDVDSAMTLFLVAGEEGFEVAQYNAAWVARERKGKIGGSPEWVDIALRGFSRSAMQGNAESLYEVGMIKKKVLKDLQGAYEDFQLAFRKGAMRAVLPLASFLESGKVPGVPRDLEKAEVVLRTYGESAKAELLQSRASALLSASSIAKLRKNLIFAFRMAKLRLHKILVGAGRRKLELS
mmetsp:Transcript_31054/g.61213  ORF Transcript_31054/g.61213 Transcript_31054/m.61213 type:complete len:662 (+) Transcript_31054:189-2174(+)